jgi:hypothetical protein
VVWELVRGTVADGLMIDHICHNRACVNPDHLREVTNKQNTENFATRVPRNNKSGHRGVYFENASRRWVARVMSDGKVVMRRFRTKEEAADAVLKMRLSLFTHNELDRREGANDFTATRSEAV